MHNTKTIISEQEFDQQTEGIDRHAFRRNMLIGKLIKIIVAVVLIALCIQAALYIWHGKVAKKTCNDILSAKAAGGVMIDGVYYADTGAIARIVDFTIDKSNNTVIVYMYDLTQKKIDDFWEVFPDARRVVFKNTSDKPYYTVTD